MSDVPAPPAGRAPPATLAAPRRLAALTGLATVAAALMFVLTAPSIAAPPTHRASLTDIENDVMCVACHEPLAVSQSPQAYAERSYIRSLIAQGETKTAIEHALVAQYGPAVLAHPPAHGFNLTIYVLPPVVLIAGLVGLALALPRWRRRASQAGTAPILNAPSLDAADARRLEEDLAQHS